MQLSRRQHWPFKEGGGEGGPLIAATGTPHPASQIGVLEQKINLNHFLIKDAKLSCVCPPTKALS